MKVTECRNCKRIFMESEYKRDFCDVTCEYAYYVKVGQGREPLP